MGREITALYFSPSGSSKMVANRVATIIGDSKPATQIDLLCRNEKSRNFDENDIIIMAFPVFSGRLPKICRKMLDNFRGNHTPVISMVVYGNRAYEDALLELNDLILEKGFCPIASGAVVAQHSIFPNVGKGRPDTQDLSQIDEFVKLCVQKLDEKNEFGISVPGNKTYKEPAPSTMHPNASTDCNGCGLCVNICPVQAITITKPRETDVNLCINCTACIHHCPQKARNYWDNEYPAIAKTFEEKCAKRQEPEFFY